MRRIKRIACLALAGLMLAGMPLSMALADDESEAQETAIEESAAKEKESEKKETEKKEAAKETPKQEKTADSGDSDGSKGSGNSGDSKDSDSPKDSDDSGSSKESDDSGSSDDSGNSDDSGSSDDSGGSDDSGNSKESDDSGSSDDSGNPDDSGSSDDSSNSDDSGNPDDSGDGESPEAGSEEAQSGEEAEDGADKTPEPQEEAGDTDGDEVRLTLTVSAPQGLATVNGAYQVDPSQVAALTLAWRCEGDCDGYDVSVSGGVYSGSTKETTLTLSVAGLAEGRYIATVSALRDGDSVAQAQLAFQIISSEAEDGGEDSEEPQPSEEEQPQPSEQQPEGGAPEGQMPGKGGFGGGRPSGGRSGGGSQVFGGEGDDEAAQGFTVTPGEALTSAHTSGSKDMSLYGSVSLSVDGEADMTRLILGDEALDISLSDDGAFTAALEGATLALVPRDGADAWTLNGYALRTLARSGVNALRLSLDGATVEFPTEPALTGKVYGALCAAGYVSRDFEYTVYADAVAVSVAGATYRLSEDGSLIE